MISKNGFMFDNSTVANGYIRVLSKVSTKRYKIRFTNKKQQYTYDLNNKGQYETYPLQMGNGSYLIAVYENVSGTRYRKLFSFKMNVKCDPLSPFLHPNQYAWYTEGSKAVSKSHELCVCLNNDQEKLDAVRDYIKRGFLYDYMKAIQVSSASQYLPDLEGMMRDKKGICFDFAALVCCMLRVQGIPTKMEIGYACGGYHAWNRAFIDGKWRLIDVTAEIAKMLTGQYDTRLIY